MTVLSRIPAGRESKKPRFGYATVARETTKRGCSQHHHRRLRPPALAAWQNTLKGISVTDALPVLIQVQLLPPPARLALRTVRGLHGLRRRQQEGHHAEPEPGLWLRLPRRSLPERERDVITPGRRQRQQGWLPARDAEQEGPVQRRGAQRAREPERCADRRHHGQGAGLERCTFRTNPSTGVRYTFAHTRVNAELTRGVSGTLDDSGDWRRDPRLLRPR